MLPSLVGVALFRVFPMAETVRRSFTTIAGQWVGLANYEALMNNQTFHMALANTGRFLAVAVPLLVALSLVVAMIAQRAPGWFKTSYLIPLSMPVACLALLWRVLFAGRGLVNAGLHALGLEAVPWMQSGASFWVLVVSYLWKNVGYDMVLILSGLVNIPSSQYEAAAMDGAGALRQFTAITLPSLRPTLYTTLLLSTLNAFKVFREAYLVAGNYPYEKMYLLQHAFNNWFLHLDIDKLCTAATLVAVGMMVPIVLLRRGWEVERA